MKARLVRVTEMDVDDVLQAGDKRGFVLSPRDVRGIEDRADVRAAHRADEAIGLLGGHDILSLARLHVLDPHAEAAGGRVVGHFPEARDQPGPIRFRVIEGNGDPPRMDHDEPRSQLLGEIE